MTAITPALVITGTSASTGEACRILLLSNGATVWRRDPAPGERAEHWKVNRVGPVLALQADVPDRPVFMWTKTFIEHMRLVDVRALQVGVDRDDAQAVTLGHDSLHFQPALSRLGALARDIRTEAPHWTESVLEMIADVTSEDHVQADLTAGQKVAR